MTSVTQKFIGLIVAPWTGFSPQVQFATLTFDDASPITFADVSNEFARRSAFRDTDATTTGDDWPGTAAGLAMKANERGHLQVLYMAEFNGYLDLLSVAPPNLLPTYVWPAVPLPSVCTIAGDDCLTTNVSDADDTPPVIATLGAQGDILDVIVSGVVNASFTAGAMGAVTGDLAASSAGTYPCSIRVRRGDQTSRTRSFTWTNS